MESVPLENLSWPTRQPVPAAFDAQGPHLGERGTAAYRKILRIPADKPALLEFEAVNFACRIFLDGKMIGEHFCGYTPFTVRVPLAANPERELVVLVENRFDFDRIPMHEPFFDFYQYGGIIRPVWLHLLPETWIEELKIDATDYVGGRIEIRGKLSLSGLLTLNILDADLPPVELESGQDGAFSHSMTIPSPMAWSPEKPHLYHLQVTCGEDQAVARFGIREIKTEGQKLLLNSQPIRLLGYNRHEFFPNFGPSTPYLQQVDDVRLLKDLGCNFVRGSHYPQDQRFLDLCDEFGLLVWEEVLGWQQKVYALENPLYRKHHRQAAREMVNRSYNHPSVILWGFLNESISDQEIFSPILEETVKIFRSLGGNRLVTFASAHPLRDLYFDQIDVISMNGYPGWYGCEDHPDPLSLIKPQWDKFIDHLDQSGFREKPILVSETGCEGLYGFRDEMRDFHSEEYQVDYIKTACDAILGNERFLGICLWHFSDARTYAGGRALRRPRGFNNKGTFDEYRRPKLARSTVASCFKKVRPG